MNQISTYRKRPGRGLETAVLFVSVFIFLFYVITARVVKDVYAYAWSGAIFEMLALPLLVLLLVCPILIVARLIQRKIGWVAAVWSLVFLAASALLIFTDK